MVGVAVETFDYNGTLLLVDSVDVHCIWIPNEDFTQLDYYEYLSDGKLYRSLKYTILERTENENGRRLVVQNGANIFAMLFWNDGDMVAFEMRDQVTLLTGELEY